MQDGMEVTMHTSFSELPNKAAATSARAGTDEQLIALIAAGDRDALGALYGRHHVRVYRFLLRLTNNGATAEDLTSEVFLETWKQADRFEGRSQVSTWMLGIARHKAISGMRRRSAEPLDDEMAEAIADGAANAEAMLQVQETVTAIRQSLTQLSAAHREIVDLVYYHGKSIAEVAEIVGVPEATVKTRMFYARKRLASLLDGYRLAA
jgi:RNA polymerase sigma-70 factor (ECF subfamily)